MLHTIVNDYEDVFCLFSVVTDVINEIEGFSSMVLILLIVICCFQLYELLIKYSVMPFWCSSLEICRKDDSDITCKDLKAFDRNFSNQRLDYTQNPNENPLDEHIIYFFLTLKQ